MTNRLTTDQNLYTIRYRGYNMELYIIIGFLAVLTILSLSYSIKALIEIESFKKSTHNIQLVSEKNSWKPSKEEKEYNQESELEFNKIYREKLGETFPEFMAGIDVDEERKKGRSY